MLIPCAVCGVPVESVRNTRRVCPDCQRESRNQSMREYSKTHKRDKRSTVLKTRHGITVDQWQNMWDSQDGECYLCGTTMTRGGGRSAKGTDAVIDHDHSCCPSGKSCENCRRGLSHRWCNDIIGRAHDDPAFLRLLADNLEHVKWVHERPAWKQR